MKIVRKSKVKIKFERFLRRLKFVGCRNSFTINTLAVKFYFKRNNKLEFPSSNFAIFNVMNLPQAKSLLEKIITLYKTVSADEKNISAIERDLMLSYTRQLYEAFSDSTPSVLAAPKVAQAVVAPPPPAPRPVAPPVVEQPRIVYEAPKPPVVEPPQIGRAHV